MNKEIQERINVVQGGSIPKGYKKVRHMLFPDDWGDPVALNTVLTENKERNEELKFDKDDVLSVSGEHGVVNQIELLGRSYAGESVEPYRVVNTGDIVYTKSPLKQNPHGIIKMNKGKPGIVSTLYAVYHCNNCTTAQYLENYFYIDSYLNNYLKPLVKRGAKNDMKVNNEDVLAGVIPLPTIKEQEKINAIIAHLDKIIELKQKTIRENRKKVKWLLKEFFDINSSTCYLELKCSEWENVALGNVCTMFSGGTPKSSNEDYYENGTIPFIRSGEISEEQTELYLTEEGYKNCSAKKVIKGDILYALYGANSGECALSKIDGAINQAILCIRTNSLNKKFLYYALINKKDEIVSTYLQGGQGNLSADIIKKICINVPNDKKVQDKIVSIIEANENEIFSLEKELLEWKRKKKSISQLLLTGIVRIK